MNLKEVFRYQNKLQALMDEAQGILSCDTNVTKVENTYLRRKVMPEAQDETVLIAPETEYYEQITGVAQFLLYLLKEKGKLFAAIRKAMVKSFIQERLLRYELDIGVVEGLVTHPDLVKERIVGDTLALICGQGHPFFGLKSVPMRELDGQTFLLREEGTGQISSRGF